MPKLIQYTIKTLSEAFYFIKKAECCFTAGGAGESSVRTIGTCKKFDDVLHNRREYNAIAYELIRFCLFSIDSVDGSQGAF